jgi:hypothetical protein
MTLVDVLSFAFLQDFLLGFPFVVKILFEATVSMNRLEIVGQILKEPFQWIFESSEF